MSIDQNLPPAELPIHDLDAAERESAAKRILIVEDEFTFTQMLQAFLESAGYGVDSAIDGVQGIKKVMANDYAVILCDMVMPNLAGDMFYLAVERVKPHLCKRFVFMTGHHNNPKIDGFIRKVNGVMLWKPFQMNTLLEAVQTVEKKGEKSGKGG